MPARHGGGLAEPRRGTLRHALGVQAPALPDAGSAIRRLRQDTFVVSGASSTEATVPQAPLRGLPPSERTLAALLRRQAERHGAKPFVTAAGGERRSYAELGVAAGRWGALLGEIGVGRGDRVAAITGNRIELLELLLGCASIGAVAVPLNPAIRGAQLQHALTNSAAGTLIIETEHLDALARVPPPATLAHVWLLDRERPHRAHGYRCEPLPALGGSVGQAALEPGDTVAIFYVPGRDGAARGVLCPNAQLYWWGILGSEFVRITEEDVCLAALPLFSAAAIDSFCQALVAGAEWVITPRFAPARHWSTAAEHRATRTHLHGSMAATLLAAPPSRDDTAHTVTIAQAPPTDAAVLEAFEERFGVELCCGYSTTETGRITSVPGEPRRPGSPGRALALGRALDEFELAVVDEDDAIVADGEAGELVVRPRHPFSTTSGYHRMPELTVRAWRNLWLHTGDRVVRDADGWYSLVETATDAISRHGEEVSSFEVERALGEHPAVAAAAVFAVRSQEGEEEVMAAVVLGPGAECDPLELVQFLEPRIAGFSIPRYVEFVATLPVGGDGSVRKRELSAHGPSDEAWDRERSGYRLARR